MIAQRSQPLSPLPCMLSCTLRSSLRSSRRRAFTMLEVLITMGIFAIGFAAVAAIFPTAILLQKKTVEDVVSQQVARNAQAMLEARGLVLAGPNELDAELLDAGAANWATDQRVYPVPRDMLVTTPILGSSVPNQTWLLPDRSYPSSSNPVESRKVFWVPLVRDPNPAVGATAGEIIVYVFIIQRASDGRYPRPDLTDTNWVNFYDGYIDNTPTSIVDVNDTWTVPGVTKQSVSVSTSDLRRFDFGSSNNTWISGGITYLKVNIGDQILDSFGGVHIVSEADADGVKIAGLINPNLDTSAFPDEIWFAHTDANGRLRPTKRILTLTQAVKP